MGPSEVSTRDCIVVDGPGVEPTILRRLEWLFVSEGVIANGDVVALEDVTTLERDLDIRQDVLGGGHTAHDHGSGGGCGKNAHRGLNAWSLRDK